jgi:DNA-directed RNA polymerase specialized sigma24 family protein
MAYDRYAAALYGYCHWMLHDPAHAAGALKDTFVIAASALTGLSEPSQLRPRLFGLARIECRRRVRPMSAVRDEADPVGQSADAAEDLSDADDDLSDTTVQFRAVGQRTDTAEELSDAAADPSDVTVVLPAVDWRHDAGVDLFDASDDLSDVTVQFRAVGRRAAKAEELSDADDLSDVTVQFPAVGRQADAGADVSDATVQFRAVGRRRDAGAGPSDVTVQFRVISQPGDPTMPFRVISQPAYGLGVQGDRGQAELRSLIHSILAGLKPPEREVIELIFRHDLHDDDLPMVLGVSLSRARTLAARARDRLEEALGALHIALTGREACPVLGKLLAEWDGQLTEQTRDLVVWHIEDCQTCTQHGWGAMRPAAFSRLLPLAPLPPKLREQVLSLYTSTAADAVEYRRRVTRRAERVWFARFSRAIGHVSWDGIRANPGLAIAVAAVAVWVVAAVSATLLTFAGSHAASAQATRVTVPRTADAQAPQTSVGTYSRNPAATPTTPASASAGPSPTVTQPPARVPTPVYSEPSRVAVVSPTPSRSASSSSQPSKSPKPSRSASPSASPSHSSSPTPTH